MKKTSGWPLGQQTDYHRNFFSSAPDYAVYSRKDPLYDQVLSRLTQSVDCRIPGIPL